jgi:hypothetical protein
MKKFLFLSLIIALIIGSCTQQKRSPVEGAWKLIFSQNIKGDSVLFKFPGTFTMSDIKMWSKGYVLYVGRYKRDTTFMDGYGGGPYKLDGNRYEETIQFFSVQSYVGQTVKMLLEIRNDTLIQTWPADDNGKINKSNFRQEKYIRLD